MKKAGLLFLVLVIFGSFSVKDSEAAQWCWQLAGSDYIRLSVAKPDPLYPFWSLDGMWYNPGSYVIPVTGTMVKSADGTQRLLNLNGTLPGATTLSQAYQMEAVIDSLTRDGTIFIYYTILGTNLEFSFNKLKCSTLPAP